MAQQPQPPQEDPVVIGGDGGGGGGVIVEEKEKEQKGEAGAGGSGEWQIPFVWIRQDDLELPPIPSRFSMVDDNYIRRMICVIFVSEDKDNPLEEIHKAEQKRQEQEKAGQAGLLEMVIDMDMFGVVGEVKKNMDAAELKIKKENYEKPLMCVCKPIGFDIPTLYELVLPLAKNLNDKNRNQKLRECANELEFKIKQSGVGHGFLARWYAHDINEKKEGQNSRNFWWMHQDDPAYLANCNLMSHNIEISQLYRAFGLLYSGRILNEEPMILNNIPFYFMYIDYNLSSVEQPKLTTPLYSYIGGDKSGSIKTIYLRIKNRTQKFERWLKITPFAAAFAAGGAALWKTTTTAQKKYLLKKFAAFLKDSGSEHFEKKKKKRKKAKLRARQYEQERLAYEQQLAEQERMRELEQREIERQNAIQQQYQAERNEQYSKQQAFQQAELKARQKADQHKLQLAREAYLQRKEEEKRRAEREIALEKARTDLEREKRLTEAQLGEQTLARNLKLREEQLKLDKERVLLAQQAAAAEREFKRQQDAAQHQRDLERNEQTQRFAREQEAARREEKLRAAQEARHLADVAENKKQKQKQEEEERKKREQFQKNNNNNADLWGGGGGEGNIMQQRFEHEKRVLRQQEEDEARRRQQQQQQYQEQGEGGDCENVEPGTQPHCFCLLQRHQTLWGFNNEIQQELEYLENEGARLTQERDELEGALRNIEAEGDPYGFYDVRMQELQQTESTINEMLERRAFLQQSFQNHEQEIQTLEQQSAFFNYPSDCE